MFEAARAYASADARAEVSSADIRTVAPMTVRLRRSQFISDYVKAQQTEENEIRGVLDELAPPAQTAA
jgi:ferritin